MLKSLDRSLWLYQAQGWEAKLDATREQLDAEQSRLLMHYVVAESVLAELDPQGRLAIPKALRTYAEITTDVVLIGLYDRIEVWSPVRWWPTYQGLKSGTKWTSGRFWICCNFRSMPICSDLIASGRLLDDSPGRSA